MKGPRKLLFRIFCRLARSLDNRAWEAAYAPDEFINWLCLANAGMLNPGNLASIEHAISNMPENTAVLEIGSFCGLSTNVIAHYRRRHHRFEPFFTTDKWIFEGAGDSLQPMGDGGITFGEYSELVRSSFIRNVEAFSRNDLPHTLEMFSDEFFKAWAAEKPCEDVFNRPANLGGPIGFCYIDGDHSYEQARRDFENTDKYLVKNGFILFDDSQDDSTWEVRDVVKEALRAGNYECVMKNPNYLLKKLVD